MEAKPGQGENLTECEQESKPIMCSTSGDHHCRSELVIGINNHVSNSYDAQSCMSFGSIEMYRYSSQLFAASTCKTATMGKKLHLKFA
jgi:hypothetical protein